jgi:carbamoyltransferase
MITSTPRYVLGVTTMDNAAAALLRDGEVLAAVEEERFSRSKHHIGFPTAAVRYCLDSAGLGLEDLSVVALSWKPWVLRRRLWLMGGQLVNPARLRARTRRSESIIPMYLDMIRLKRAFERHLATQWPPGLKVEYQDHHLSHAASAYYASGFEEAAFLTYDGTGEDTCTMLGRASAGRLEVLKRVPMPHSLGWLYASVTAFLGFKPNCDEGKTMALASYGDPSTYRPLFDRLLRVRDDRYTIDTSFFDYHRALIGDFPAETRRACGEPRAPGAPLEDRDRDLAAALQEALERAGVALARGLQPRTGMRDVCLAGGVALNSVLGYRVLMDAGFERIFVQPASHDAGSALGAAWLSASRFAPPPTRAWRHAFWGPRYDAESCERALVASGLPYERCGEDVVRRAAEAIAAGKLVAWFQGPAEFGPRALGARSILADPADPCMPGVLNLRVKHREAFRPFAPACLEEEAHHWFDLDQPSRFMLLVAPVRTARRAEVPAITHVDGTARLQTVPAEPRTRFRALIETYQALRKVPMVLNTSFNVQGEPMVGTPEDALRTFLGTHLDCLAMEDFFVEKTPGPVRA